MTPRKIASAGLSPARLDRITSMFQGYVDRGDIAGMAASVARNGQTAYLNSVGWADKEAQKPLELDAIYRIASMTKPVTSVAAMMLYEEGYFHLNTPVEKFIPEFKDLKVFVRETGDGMELSDLDIPVTMRHLFTHTSGICYGFDPKDPIDRLIQESSKKYENNEPSMEEEVANLVTIPLAFQPGTKWRYGYNIEVLGRIVEIISGQSLDAFMRAKIFEPLRMPDTGFYVPPEKGSRVPVLYGHPEGPGPLKRLSDEFTSKPPRNQSGGGGLLSTLADYSRFCQMLVNGGELDGVRLLSPSTVGMYSTNYAPLETLPFGLAERKVYHQGYGFSLATRVLMDPSKTGMAGSVGEFGWDGAFNTYFWIDPSLQLYGVLMLQHLPHAFFPIAQQFKQLTYQALVP